METTFYLLPMPFFVFAIIFFSSLLQSPGAVEINAIAARVNGKVITKKEIAILMQPRIMALQSQIKEGIPLSPQKTNLMLKEAEQEILQELIDNKIILSELETRQASLPDHIVEQDMQRIIKEIYKGSEQAFRADLKKAGTTWSKYKELQKEKILVQAFKNQTIGSINPPTTEELEAERQKMHSLPSARDFSKDTITFEKIYIMTIKEERNLDTGEIKSVDPKEQEQLAKDLYDQLKKGASFSALAKEYSDDSYAQDGGLATNISRDDLNADFASLMFDAPLGELIGPIPDRAMNLETKEVVTRGFTLLRVKSINFGPLKPLSELKPILMSRVTKQKQRAKFERWIQPKRKSAIIHKSL